MAETFKVGLLVESSREYGRGVLRGIAAFARTAGNWSIYHQEQLLSANAPLWLRRWAGDGIIARVETPALARRLTRSKLPAIDLTGTYPLPRTPVIETDDRAVTQMAIDHLRERGFRNLAFCGFAGAVYSERRERYFAESLMAAALPICVYDEPQQRGVATITTMDIEAAGLTHEKQLAKWLCGLPKPVGVIACNDIRGLQVLNVCREHQISVPDDVAVIGVDNDEVLCELAGPRLTSVEQDTERIGYQAAELLQRMMKGERNAVPPRPVAPLRVVVRASTDVYALDDRAVATALRFIRSHASDGIDVADVVRHVGVSRTTLERRMQRRLGRSPLAEINRVRLERVKQLLTETEYTLSVIANLSGFAYSEYMIAFFRRCMKVTPGEYRRATTVGKHS
ncbi:MAG: DNA-binding transcriptional regulator [Pirellulales bacterium]